MALRHFLTCAIFVVFAIGQSLGTEAVTEERGDAQRGGNQSHNDGKAILDGWLHWSEECFEQCQAVKIVEKADGREHDTVYLVSKQSGNRFQWSHRYYAKRGWTENVAAGNARYAFTLRKKLSDYELADIKTQDELEFANFHSQLLQSNPFTNMLLSGSHESILALVKQGVVTKTKFIADNIAVINVSVSDNSSGYDVPQVQVMMKKEQQWLPQEVSWDVILADKAGKSTTTYRYSDWIDVNGCQFPTVVESTVKSGDTKRVLRNELSYVMSATESAEVSRCFLTDFGLPEPSIASTVPNWAWVLMGGIGCIVLAGLTKWKRLGQERRAVSAPF